MIWFWGKFGIDISSTKKEWFQWIFRVFDKFDGFPFLKVFFLVWINTICSSITMKNWTYHIRREIKLLIWFPWLFLSSFTKGNHFVSKKSIFRLSVLPRNDCRYIFKGSSSISSGFEFIKARDYWHHNQTRYFPNWYYMTWIKILTSRVFQFRLNFGFKHVLNYKIELKDARLWARGFWHTIELPLLNTE